MNAGAVLVLKIRYLHWTRPPITGFFKNKFFGKLEGRNYNYFAHTQGPNCRNSEEENSSEIKKSADI